MKALKRKKWASTVELQNQLSLIHYLKLQASFFPSFFHCSVLSSSTMSTTQHETPDSHHRDYSLIAIDFSLLPHRRQCKKATWKCPPWSWAKAASADLGEPILSLSSLSAEVRDSCLVPHLGAASLPSLLLWCGQTFVRSEGKLFAVSARNPIAHSVTLMRRVPLEILLQNSEVNTSLIKTQVHYHQQIIINYLHEHCSE